MKRALVLLVVATSLKAEHPGCTVDGQALNCSHAGFTRISQTARAGDRESWMPSLVSQHITELSLSGNFFTSLNTSSFAELRHPSSLLRLDLSNNKILYISPIAFKALTNLKHLNLSGNNLHTINRTAFADLENLESLVLDDNPLASFPDKTFANLESLQSISIRSNQLTCDCQLADFIKIHPDTRPLVVQPGEERVLRCLVSVDDEGETESAHVEWLRHNVPLEPGADPRLLVEQKRAGALLTAIVRLKTVTWEDEGDWTCRVDTTDAYITNTTRLIPIGKQGATCRQELTASEKGEHTWPTTLNNRNVELDCVGGPPGEKIRRRCSNGKWKPEESSACAYASPRTRDLHQLLISGKSEKFLSGFMMLVGNDSARLDAYDTRVSGWLLGNSTETFRDSTAPLKALTLLLTSPFAEKELDGIGLRHAIQQLPYDESRLDTKQLAACQFMRNDIVSAEVQRHKQGLLFSRSDSSFTCGLQTNLRFFEPSGMSQVGIPEDSLASLPSIVILRLFWFPAQHLFHRGYTPDTSLVALDEVLGIAVKPISRPSAQTLATTLESTTVGIYFNFVLKRSVEGAMLGEWVEGSGWQKLDACHLIQGGPVANAVLVHCPTSLLQKLSETISYFTILQNSTNVDVNGHKIGIRLPWWLYMTSGFLSSALFLTIVVNVVFFGRGRIYSRKLLHCLVNTCLLISGFCLCFTLGIDKVFEEQVCQSVGATLHFLFLAAVFWCLAAVRVVQRKTSDRLNGTAGRVLSDASDDSIKAPKHGQISGLYFFAYGLPAMAVAYSLAIDRRSYSTASHYCFPPPGTHFATLEIGVIVPTLCALGVLLVLLLLLYYSSRMRRSQSPNATQGASFSAVTTGPLEDDSYMPLVQQRHPHSSDSASLATTVIDTHAWPWLLGFFISYAVSSYLLVYHYVPTSKAKSHIPYTLVHCALALVISTLIGYVHIARRFHLMWRDDRCLEPSVVVEVSAIVDEAGYANGLVAALTTTRTSSPLVHRDPPASLAQTYESWSHIDPSSASYTGRMVLDPELVAQRERAMHRAARNFYKRQRQQVMNNSAASSTLQSPILEEPRTNGVAVGDGRPKTDYYQVEMDQLSANYTPSSLTNSSDHVHMMRI